MQHLLLQLQISHLDIPFTVGCIIVIFFAFLAERDENADAAAFGTGDKPGSALA